MKILFIVYFVRCIFANNLSPKLRCLQATTGNDDKRFHNLSDALSRISEISLDKVVAPGNNTLCCINQVVAKSNMRLGRSLPIQVRAYINVIIEIARVGC